MSSAPDRKSTRLNSSHSQISYAVFCLKKKTAHRPFAAANPSVAEKSGLRIGLLWSCTTGEPPITVPAHYDCSLSADNRRCLDRHAPVLCIMRKTSPRRNAGSPKGTERSGKKSLARRERNEI